jgi:hypothetical protein
MESEGLNVVKIKLSKRSLTDESRIWGDKGTHRFGIRFEEGGDRENDFEVFKFRYGISGCFVGLG